MFDMKQCKDFLTNIMELEDFEDDFGDLMSMNEFIESVETKCIMDYDGWGDVIYKGKNIKNAVLHVDEKMVYFYDDKYDNYAVGVTLYMLKDIFGRYIKINWYNK